MEAEAELLAAIVAFFSRLGLGPADVGLKVSSRKVLQAVLARYGVAEASFGPVCVVVDKMEKIPREKVRCSCRWRASTCSRVAWCAWWSMKWRRSLGRTRVRCGRCGAAGGGTCCGCCCCALICSQKSACGAGGRHKGCTAAGASKRAGGERLWWGGIHQHHCTLFLA